MATDTRNKNDKAGGASDIARRAASRSEVSGPFSLMRQMQDEVDRFRAVAHGGKVA